MNIQRITPKRGPEVLSIATRRRRMLYSRFFAPGSSPSLSTYTLVGVSVVSACGEAVG